MTHNYESDSFKYETMVSQGTSFFPTLSLVLFDVSFLLEKIDRDRSSKIIYHYDWFLLSSQGDILIRYLFLHSFP
jgi:hypothetical protein